MERRRYRQPVETGRKAIETGASLPALGACWEFLHGDRPGGVIFATLSVVLIYAADMKYPRKDTPLDRSH